MPFMKVRAGPGTRHSAVEPVQREQRNGDEMAIEMGFNFYRSATQEFLSFNIEPGGTLFDSYINTSADPIAGTYDQATRAVNFRTVGTGRPGGNFFVLSYSGYAILDGDGNIFAMAGTSRDLGIVFEPAGVDEQPGAWFATALVNME